MKNKWCIALLLFFPILAFANSSQLTQIQISKTNTSARVKFDLSESAPYRSFALSHPDRLVVDFPNTRLVTPLKEADFQNSFIKMVRSGHPDPNTLRLVFDLNKNVEYKIFSQNQTIYLDIYTASSPPPHTIKTVVMSDTPKTQPIVIVIDPGHGGKDPGAQGQYGTQEKNIVLIIAKLLAQKINEDPHMHAVLTRHGDYFVPLADRLKLARKGKADLFVAIHADSYFNAQSSGASVYALSRRGATSVAARWLSDKENHSELGGVDLRGLGDQSLQLRSVLIDLAQTATITDSLRLGTTLLDTLEDVTNLHYSRVEQAPFLVLKSPDIPSVLIEIGFLSNPQEEKKLRDSRYQNTIAQALFNGIHLYLKKYSAHL